MGLRDRARIGLGERSKKNPSHAGCAWPGKKNRKKVDGATAGGRIEVVGAQSESRLSWTTTEIRKSQLVGDMNQRFKAIATGHVVANGHHERRRGWFAGDVMGIRLSARESMGMQAASLARRWASHRRLRAWLRCSLA
ncbi:hypothetical protein ACFXTN_043101 [Malus domestica]